MSPASERPKYTTAQLEQYFDHVELPAHCRITAAEANTTEHGLKFLKRILLHQLSYVPFENLDLHYSQHHSISLDTEHLFHKIVERRNGRGGYCMENNTFFGTILRSLGFQVMPVGARVSNATNATKDAQLDNLSYSGFTHTVNIVTISGKKYFVDVGFGARGPTSPIPLQEGVETRTTGSMERGGTMSKLTREHIQDNSHQTSEQLLWVYNVRFSENTKWFPTYCFTEVEFLPQDFQVMSFYVSRSPSSLFTYAIMCQKFIVEKEGKEGLDVVIGYVTLDGRSVKRRLYAEGEELVYAEKELDRVEALKQYFGIHLAKAEINGIKGMVSAISG